MEVVEISDGREGSLTAETARLRECPGEALCKECFWSIRNGGQCQGCDEDYRERCLKQVCNYNCYDCSGGGHANTPGCCGRNVAIWPDFLDKYKSTLEYPLTDYTPDPLYIKCRLIPALNPEVGKYKIPEHFPQIDAWAVPLRKVAGRTGHFYSDDLKDYLGIPPNRKLILDTCAPDDYQETLWEKVPQIEYKKYGIDYWFPGHFSIYDDDSKLYQFVSAKRQQIHAVLTQSQFVWFRLGENIPVEFLNPIRAAPSVLISTNRMASQQSKEVLLREVAIADSWFPPETAFFIVGSPHRLRLSDTRTCYQINTSWLVRAICGRDMTEQKRLSREELLIENIKEVLRRYGRW